jgi:hypothetical protein
MKTFLTTTAAGLCLAGTAFAAEPAQEPIELTATDMDQVSAGVLDDLRLGAVIPVSAILANAGTAASIGLLSENVVAGAEANATSFNATDLNLGDLFDLGDMGLPTN